MENISVLLADNQTLTRAGVSLILSQFFNHHITVDHAKSRAELYEKLKEPPHVLIIDYDIFDLDSLQELSELRKAAPCMGILVLTDNHSTDDVLTALECGITNYILKSCEKQELIDAFNATLANKKYFSSSILDILLERKNTTRKSQIIASHITPSELEIIKLVAHGLTTKEIADQKNLSYHTVITHRKNIFRKLGINSASELIMYAMKSGMVDTTEYYI